MRGIISFSCRHPYMTETTEAVALTADIVSAYVSNNSIESGELANLISQVHKALTSAAEGPKAEPEPPPTPAVPVKKSITPDYLISLEDGRKYKSLKRHLSTRGMTPEDYRTKWGLPKDYPMVAASYSAQRSSLAKSLGLGRARAGGEDTPAEPAAAAEAPKPARGRRKAS
jgi:predicted transcriptional regulator